MLRDLDRTSHELTFGELARLRALHEECTRRAFVFAYSFWLGVSLINYKLTGSTIFEVALGVIFVVVYVVIWSVLVVDEYCNRGMAKKMGQTKAGEEVNQTRVAEETVEELQSVV